MVQKNPATTATLLRKRLNTHDPADVLDGLAREGYRLVFDASETSYAAASELDSGARDFSSAIGLTIGKGGIVRSVAWDGPAFKSGLAPGMTIDAINGAPYAADALAAALRSAPTSDLSISWKLDGLAVHTTIHPTAPLTYPHLVRLPGTRDRLAKLLSPR